MSNYNEIEERLFLLLDTVEKQTEENKELKQTITNLLETVQNQQAIIAEQNQAVVANAEQQIKQLQMAQSDFNNLVYSSITAAMKKQIANDVRSIAAQSVFDGVSLSSNAINDEMKSLVNKLDEWNRKTDSALAKNYKYTLSKSEQIMASLDSQTEKLGNQYLKLTAIVGGGLFLLMCVFFFVIYLVAVPTKSEIKRLNNDKAAIQSQITALQVSRDAWFRDAQAKGYYKQ